MPPAVPHDSRPAIPGGTCTRRSAPTPGAKEIQVAQDIGRAGVAFDDVVGAVTLHSPDIACRKAGRILGDARKTARAAFQGASRHGVPLENSR